MTTEPEADTLELPPVPEFGAGRPRWAAQRIHPRRLAHGHLAQWARLRAWTVATGHPTPGKARTRRAAGLAAAALLTWRTGHQQPQLLAIAAGAYTITAWRAGRPVPPTPPTEEELRRRVVLGVQQLLADRPAVFLRDVYDAFQARPTAAHLDDTRLRAVLVHCGITIHRSVRVSTTQTGRSGIKAADIAALLSPTPVDTPSKDVDAGQRLPEEAVDRRRAARRPPTTHPQKEITMPANHDITIRGRLLLPDGVPVTCPDCDASTELTIYGPDGGAGNLMCPDGHHFAVPAPIDPVDLLARAVADPRTDFLS